MQSNHDAFINLAKKISLAHMKEYGNTWRTFDRNSKFYCTIEPEVFDKLSQYGSDTLYMIIFPVLMQVHTLENEIFDKIYLMPMFCVKKDDLSNVYQFFDLTGRAYSDVQDFLENNHLPPGKIAFPKDFHYEMDPETDEIIVEWVNIDTDVKLDEIESKRHNNWINLLSTAGITTATALAVTSTGAFPAFGVLLGAAMLYGDDEKCDPLDDPILKEMEESAKLFEDYNVLLPKDYKTSKCTEMPSPEITRKMIIMAGHHIDVVENKIKSSQLLFNAINKEFGDETNKWQVFCATGLCLYDIHPKNRHFMNLNIKGFDFVIFVPAISIPNNFNEELYKSIKGKFKINNCSDIKKNININNKMENIALRLCTNNLQPKEIAHCMQDIFGGYWNCFLFAGYHSYHYTFNGYITMDSGDRSYCLFN